MSRLRLRTDAISTPFGREVCCGLSRSVHLRRCEIPCAVMNPWRWCSCLDVEGASAEARVSRVDIAFPHLSTFRIGQLDFLSPRNVPSNHIYVGLSDDRLLETSWGTMLI